MNFDLKFIFLLSLFVLTVRSEEDSECTTEDADIYVPSSDCTKFWQYSNGKAILMECPSGLLFNVDTIQCDWPENVDCSNVSSTTTQSSDDEEIAPECSSDDSESYIPNSDCTKFWQCSDGRAILQECPSGLLFNNNTNYCDWPDLVVC
ncbi:peritrophin-1-like [Diorhabda sublineata]|uniref:peritrophin-1-like n=1 Tax=Diorhabda sublineata TaxID=1163346 RepID=UPI0024E17D67|nr:peritrophin-1-like [Diorhabda sublineata]